MIYVAGWLFNYLMMAASRWDRDRRKIYSALVVVALGAMAVLRGPTGTDTLAYERLSLILRTHTGMGGVEPLFALLMRGLQWFLTGDALIVRAVAVIAILLLLIYVRRADEDEQYFLLAVFMPAFFYSYTMNTLRIGMASVVLLLGAQQFRRSHTLAELQCYVSGVVAFLLQYTSVFVVCFLVAVLRPWSKKLVLGVVSVFVVIAALIAAVSTSYFATKLALYADATAPSHLSGLSRVVGTCILLYGVWRSQLLSAQKLRVLSLSIVCLVTFFGIAQVSSAGLRLLGLLSFALPFAILCVYSLQNQRLDRPIKIALFVFGVVTAGFVFRNFLTEPASSIAPFLPYRWIFQQ